MSYKELVEAVDAILRLVFGANVPAALLRGTGLALSIGGALYASYVALIALGKLRRVWRDEISPMFYDAEKRRRVLRRQRFADHIESELRRLDNTEEWRDYRYAELEAEVEAEGDVRRGFVWRLRRRNTLRRERSLSRALARSSERLILVEGDPGAGKSVALRHLARILAARAIRSRNVRTVVPLYINLRTLDRQPETAIDPDLIEQHVLKTLNRFNSRDIDEFLSQEYRRGMHEGTWLFLFDSFDEIPEVLSSVDADATLRQYAQAIADFLQGLNVCRGIVASRQFRGPRSLGWPRFRVLDLTDERRAELVRRADLPSALERDLLRGLPNVSAELSAIARNPMFVGLLCEFVRERAAIPPNAHAVFEDYVSRRMKRDEAKLRARFSIDPLTVRDGAEELAIRIIERPHLGLSPLRHELVVADASDGGGVLLTCMDALEYIRLARHDESADGPTFTFAHRRFQEYFATCAAIRQPERLDPVDLLLNGRWRETAVTMLQTQPTDALQRLFDAITQILEECAKKLEPFPHGEIAAWQNQFHLRLPEFVWPSHSLHLLSLLQSGLAGRHAEIPARIRLLAGRIVSTGFTYGTVVDRRAAVEMVGITERWVAESVVQRAFRGSSYWIADAAFTQASRLPVVAADLYDSICDHLLSMFSHGQLHRSWQTTLAQLSRLSHRADLRRSAWLLRSLRPIDVAIHDGILIMLYLATPTAANAWMVIWLAMPVTVAILTLRFAGRRRRFNAYTGVVATLRGLISAMLVVLTFKATTSTTLSVIAGVASMWPLFAIGAARQRLLTHPALWAVLMTWPAIPAGRYLIRQRRDLPLMASDAITPLAFMAVACAGTSLLFIISARALAQVIAVLGVLALPFFAAAIVKPSWQLFQELRFWARSRRRIPRGVTVDELSNLLDSLQTRPLQVSLVRLIRRRDLLVQSSSVAPETYRLAMQMERELDGDDMQSAELIDELSMLASDMRQRGASDSFTAVVNAPPTSARILLNEGRQSENLVVVPHPSEPERDQLREVP